MTVDVLTDKRITVKEASELIGFGERQIYDLIREGKLIGYKLGSHAIRISLTSVKVFIESSRINPDDYFDPDLEKQNVQEQTVIRSNWMARK